ncbi:MAG TPA: tetratricopeptide repeat protein [Polyangia bacterium]|nr:tetratricopeptide repeat protein [Polyangia bacterium]
MRLFWALATLALVCSLARPASALTEEEERAKAHFLAGQSYYDQASYADALKEFNEAYRLSKKPALLYNIARCYEGLGQLGDAVNMLERYVTDEPDASDRTSIEERIHNLKERQKHAAEVATPPAAPKPVAVTPPPAIVAPPPPRTAPDTAPRHRRWTWIVGGAGVAILGGALGTGITSQLDYDSLHGDCPNKTCTAGNAQSRIDDGKTLSLATDILWPVGAAAVATGVVLFFVEGRHGHVHAALAPPLNGGSQHASTR